MRVHRACQTFHCQYMLTSNRYVPLGYPGPHPSRNAYFSLGQKWWGTILGIRIICMLGGGGEVWGFIWVLVVPTMFSLCSQQVPKYAPNVFPKFPMCFPSHRPPNILGIRIICMLRGGGSLRFYLGFGGSHHVLILFLTGSQWFSTMLSIYSQQVPNVVLPPPHPPRESNKF
jgi:hypothetical protein